MHKKPQNLPNDQQVSGNLTDRAICTTPISPLLPLSIHQYFKTHRFIPQRNNDTASEIILTNRLRIAGHNINTKKSRKRGVIWMVFIIMTRGKYVVCNFPCTVKIHFCIGGNGGQCYSVLIKIVWTSSRYRPILTKNR